MIISDMKRMKIVYAVAILLAAAACQKTTYDCDLYINTRTQASSGAEIERLDDVVAFAYYGDTLDYSLKDYEQAVSGHVTTSKDEQTRPADIRGDYSLEEGRIIFHRLSQPVTFVVVCDTRNRIYGYYQQTIGKGLDNVFVTFTSAPWRFEGASDVTVKEGQWYYRKGTQPVPES